MSIALAVLLATTLGAQQDTTRLLWVPNPRTTSGGWVSDPARHLSETTVVRMDSIISALQRETTSEIAVVVIDSLDGMDAHTAAFTLHRRWGVGERARDNGIVLLWSPGLRQTYVSVGPGLEGVMPDAVVGRIQDEAILPHFRRGDFDEGMIAGVAAIAAAARGESYAGRPAERRNAAGILSTIAQLALAMFVAIGAALGWRRRPRRCPRGHGWMTKLAETRDDSELSAEDVLEERLGSMNYHVWVCGSCEERLIVPRRRWFSTYQPCPKCARRTLKKTMKQLQAATYTSVGFAEVTEKCRNCDYASIKRVTIPQLRRSASGEAGGSSRGGFSSSGGSFGGGSSGGGGAGRSY